MEIPHTRFFCILWKVQFVEIVKVVSDWNHLNKYCKTANGVEKTTTTFLGKYFESIVTFYLQIKSLLCLLVKTY